MRGTARRLAGTILVLAAFAVTATALSITVFDKMDYADQNNFVALALVQGGYRELAARGETEQAEKLLSLFKDQSENGGWHQFEKNLAMARALNQKHAADPTYTKPPYEVENAMALTLKDAGIEIPASKLLAMGKDFKPANPPVKDVTATKNTK